MEEGSRVLQGGEEEGRLEVGRAEKMLKRSIWSKLLSKRRRFVRGGKRDYDTITDVYDETELSTN
jgi:hypothetical protein